MNHYITCAEARKQLCITATTLSRWVIAGRIPVKKLSPRKFLYDISGILEGVSGVTNKKHVIYARVSNSKQKDDLATQISILRSYVAVNGNTVEHVYSDIASGMNDQRKSLNLLIDSVIDHQVDTIYISYKDRLTRFGYGYLENLFVKFGTKIVVINSTAEEDFQTELTEDLVSVIHHFSMKMYSNRRKTLKEMAKKLQETGESL